MPVKMIVDSNHICYERFSFVIMRSLQGAVRISILDQTATGAGIRGYGS